MTLARIDVHVPLHGADARAHDWHTRRPGSFDAAVARIREARAAGRSVAVATPLTRSVYRALAPMPALLEGLGVAAWTIAIVAPATDDPSAIDPVVPRLGLALPHALRAIDAARRLGIAAHVAGAPLCTLGPFAAIALPEAPRAFAATCGACTARSRCAGLDAAYLARFGDAELSAERAPSGPPAERTGTISSHPKRRR